jgi:hypothetical protein
MDQNLPANATEEKYYLYHGIYDFFLGSDEPFKSDSSKWLITFYTILTGYLSYFIIKKAKEKLKDLEDPEINLFGVSRFTIRIYAYMINFCWLQIAINIAHVVYLFMMQALLRHDEN